jgi:hypothetical protein
VFSIVNGVLILPLPYKDPAALVTIFERIPQAPVDHFQFSAPDFEIVRDIAHAYTGMAAYRNATYELSGVSDPQRLVGSRVSPELFSVLGVGPALGRTLTTDDDRTNAHVAVLTYGLWAGALGADPAVVGRSILLDRQPYTVVGVMPERFEFPPRGSDANGEPAAFYVPIAFSALEHLSVHARSIVCCFGSVESDRIALSWSRSIRSPCAPIGASSAGRSSATWPWDWHHWKPRHRRRSPEKTAL